MPSTEHLARYYVQKKTVHTRKNVVITRADWSVSVGARWLAIFYIAGPFPARLQERKYPVGLAEKAPEKYRPLTSKERLKA